MSDTPTPLHVIDATPDAPDYESMTSAERQIMTLEKMDVILATFARYDTMIEHGFEQVNGVLAAAENNPMLKSILGL